MVLLSPASVGLASPTVSLLPPVHFVGYPNGNPEAFPRSAREIFVLDGAPGLLHVAKGMTAFAVSIYRDNKSFQILDIDASSTTPRWSLTSSANTFRILEVDSGLAHHVTYEQDADEFTIRTVSAPLDARAFLHRDSHGHDYFDAGSLSTRMRRIDLKGEPLLKWETPVECGEEAVLMSPGCIVIARTEKGGTSTVEIHSIDHKNTITLTKTLDVSFAFSKGMFISDTLVLLLGDNRLAFVNCSEQCVAEAEIVGIRGKLWRLAATLKQWDAEIFVSTPNDNGHFSIFSASIPLALTELMKGPNEAAKTNKQALRSKVAALKDQMDALTAEKQCIENRLADVKREYEAAVKALDLNRFQT